MATNKLLLPLLACAILPAATRTVCDSGCDYTTANLQSALTDLASCGNHVQLKAQANPYPPVYLPGGNNLQCGANPNYLENFAMGALPPAGVLVTPPYAPLMPYVQTSSNQALLAHNSNVDCGGGNNAACPANGWVIQGLRFGETAARPQSPCLIVLGLYSNCGSSDAALRTTADLPQNIAFRSNYIQTDPHTVTRRCIDMFFVGGTIRDNWIDCLSPTFIDSGTGDSQAMNGDPIGTSAAPVLIENNYIVGATESIGFGTTPHPIRTPTSQQTWFDTTTTLPNWIKVSYNHVPKETYMMTAKWTADTWLRVGQAVTASTGALPLFIAITTGKTSGSEPDWPAAGIGSTVVDGGVTWANLANQWNNGTCSYSVKNHLETKSATNLQVVNNFMDQLWAQCAAFGPQGRSFAIEVQSSPNGGGSASFVSNVTVANNLSTNISAAIGTLYQGSTDDPNNLPRFMTSVVEPYAINATNDTLKISVDGQAPVTVTLTHGTRTAFQIVTEINSAGGGSAITNIGAVAANWALVAPHVNGTCSGTECIILIQRARGPAATYPYYTDSTPNPWSDSLARAISIGLATGTTATSVLGLPANGTSIYPCTNPYSWVWYGCGSGTNINFVNNLFQMRHDGLHAPYVAYIALANGGADGQLFDHNTFDDPTGWHSSLGGNILNPQGKAASGANLRWGSKNTRISNNSIADQASGQYVTGFTNSTGVLSDWSAINYGCQTEIPNADLTAGGDTAAQCDAGHLKGGFSRNLVPNALYANTFLGFPCSPGLTCNTTGGNYGYLAYPSDNPNFSFNSILFRNKTGFDYAPVFNPSSPQTLVQPANFGDDNRPMGVDMTQMNFVRLAGSPAVSDRAAIFTFNVTPPIQGFTGMFTVATDPFCFSPVADMDPAQFANPGWTGNDKFPQFGSTRSVIVGLNAPLSPNTEYFYCLEYQGYSLKGPFSTKRALSGTTSAQMQTTLTNSTQGAGGANNMIVEYGTSYSRATDTISGGATTAPVSCTVNGGVCAASFSPTAGVPLYYRYKIRNAANTVLIAQPVNLQLPQ